jgi:hypothetical protein
MQASAGEQIMKRHIIAVLGVALWCFSDIMMAQTSSTEQAVQAPMSFKVFNAPTGMSMSRAATVAKALDFAKWPETKALFNAPRITKVLLKAPAAVTQASHSCTKVPFGDTLWDNCHWAWRRLIERKETPPAELPPERREQILAALSEEQRKNPQLVAAHLKRQLERYQQAQRYRLDGQVDIEVCLTPSGRAAQEFLLTKLTDNMMPTEELTAMYAAAQRPEEIGTISFVVQSRSGDDRRVTFVRNNVFVSIQATGFFADEALSIAAKIDHDITQQPSLTLEELQKQVRAK